VLLSDESFTITYRYMIAIVRHSFIFFEDFGLCVWWWRLEFCWYCIHCFVWEVCMYFLMHIIFVGSLLDQHWLWALCTCILYHLLQCYCFFVYHTDCHSTDHWTKGGSYRPHMGGRYDNILYLLCICGFICFDDSRNSFA